MVTLNELRAQAAVEQEVVADLQKASAIPVRKGGIHGPPPKMAPEAFRGIAGRVVDITATETEASLEALLVDFLIKLGNALGRGPHIYASGARHGTNDYANIVGRTGGGRKGSSSGLNTQLFKAAYPEWANERIMGGLSSGEGIVHHVRDAITRLEPIKENGKHTGAYEDVTVDPGVQDKRLMAFEPELAQVLAVIKREGSTLTTQLRQAWDEGDLRVMTKNNPGRATGAHVSMLGHITKEELLVTMPEVHAFSGFANRSLWIWTERRQLLPHGGNIPNWGTLVGDLRAVIDKGSHERLYTRSSQANELWEKVYPHLTSERPGLFGAITARADAHALRLQLLYAVMDGAEHIQFDHVESALAVWKYAEDSARYIWGDRTGNRDADKLLDALRDDGPKSKTALHVVLGNHASATRLGAALEILISAQLASVIHKPSDRGGTKPVEVWFAT